MKVIIMNDQTTYIVVSWDVEAKRIGDGTELIKFIEAAINAYEDWKVDGE